ncbi:MAG: hypothetical protein EXX96DRAFT_472491, partial [Benjaminiella poitrasii]
SFSYLGIPVKPGGYLDTVTLLQDNTEKALQTINQLAAIGVSPRRFDRLLAVRFYSQIVRPQLEYDLAISSVIFTSLRKLEACQNECLRIIFGGSSCSSFKVMLHLVNQTSIRERIAIL